MADIASSLSIKGELSHQSVEDSSTPDQKTSSRIITISLSFDLVVKLTKPILILCSLFCPKQPSPEDHPDIPYSEHNVDTRSSCSDHHTSCPSSDQNIPAAMSTIENKSIDTTLTGIAAILNPLDNNEILEFYTTAYRNLGMKTEAADNLNSDGLKLGEYQPPSTPGVGWDLGPLLPGTPLVVLKYKSQIRVYGISKYYNKKKENVVLSVSPSTAGLDITTNINALAGTGDGQKRGWLYELEDKPIGRTVKEYSLEGDGSKVGKAKDVPLDGVGKNSNISAFYHKKGDRRYVVYQGSDNYTLRWKPLSSKAGEGDLFPVSFVGTTAMKRNTLQGWTTHAGCAIEDTAFLFYVGSETLTAQGVKEEYSKLYVIRTDFKSSGQETPEDLNLDVLKNGALSLVPTVNKEGTYDIVVFYMGAGDGDNRLLSNYVYPTDIPAPVKT
ncbi:hypothetical protein TWF225_004304 [Orbilia oligospora]|nr:hypothetical protein TWF225_004304 [Orbilia oligospora]KAF3258577.1 hypothetical protein TWF217_005354 [Orbilia oligospora]KAF3267025.1 hypothetical protein TWF128_009987 [Orbilia oligospora]KAF3274481.1 hypothetical protein TWF132_003518 [Orbilia oligospora]